MLNWNNLKLDIFKAINNYPLMDSLESSEEIISLSWSIPHVELGNLFPSFRGIQKYFWSNKNGDEYIGLGLCQEYKTDLDIEKLEKLINSSKNKDKKIQAFATHLFSKENDTKQVVNNSDWKNFHNSHYIVPMITIKNQSHENEQTQVIICLKSNQLNNETAKSRTIFKIESLLALNFDRLKKISIKNTIVLPNRLEWNKNRR
ncbi:hypothetical protein OAT67_09535 [Bacteriovoracaceae bacterium]|nr:hypothetical protein [Bacteriovoracaceae bacterium]